MQNFHFIVKRLELNIRDRKWQESFSTLEAAKAIQPRNPYLRAFEERIAEESKALFFRQ